MLGLEFEGWLTLAIVVMMFIALVREWFGPDIVMFAALVLLWAGGVIDGTEATAGFSNSQVLTVGLLFVVATAVQQTGALSFVQRLMLGDPRPTSLAIVRLLLPVAALSAFLNNTPIVAMFTPVVRKWAHKHDLRASRFLIPLSFAAILGGTCTLIGTSTNLVVSGLLEERGLPPLGMFELSVVGVPAAIVGLLYIALVGWRLLPERTAPDERPQTGRRYSATVRVEHDWPHIGSTVEDAGLRHLEGLFLVEIRRGDRRIVPVRPTDVLRADDLLILYGRPDTVVQLIDKRGLSIDGGEELLEEDGEPGQDDLEGRHIHEIVIREGSVLVGATLKKSAFRRRYDAAVIGIYRDGIRLRKKLGDVRLRVSDTLLVQASSGFRKAFAGSKDFYLLSTLETPLSIRHTAISLLTLAAMVSAMATGISSPLFAVAVAAVLLVVTRCVEPSKARRSIDLSVLIVIASSFGVSAAVQNSGLAAVIADLLGLAVGQGASPWLALLAVYLMCTVTTELLSNNAAAALIFPIALSTAAELSLDPRPFAIVVAIAASLSFVTPLGYQTNLLVYGPGGYRFGDFGRIGLPLALLCMVTCVTAVVVFFGVDVV